MYFIRRKPLTILYGMESDEMAEGPKLVPTLQTFRVKPKYPFGSHHTYKQKTSLKVNELLFLILF